MHSENGKTQWNSELLRPVAEMTPRDPMRCLLYFASLALFVALCVASAPLQSGRTFGTGVQIGTDEEEDCEDDVKGLLKSDGNGNVKICSTEYPADSPDWTGPMAAFPLPMATSLFVSEVSLSPSGDSLSLSRIVAIDTRHFAVEGGNSDTLRFRQSGIISWTLSVYASAGPLSISAVQRSSSQDAEIVNRYISSPSSAGTLSFHGSLSARDGTSSLRIAVASLSLSPTTNASEIHSQLSVEWTGTVAFDRSNALPPSCAEAFSGEMWRNGGSESVVATSGDRDGDRVADACDNCVDVADTEQRDGDSDGVGDVCDLCGEIYNPGQEDGDGDIVGDVCDNCPSHANTDQSDVDGDLLGDVCDNCPSVENTDQSDVDSDSVGDVCDNCPSDANSDQSDGDGDSFGDVCDNCASVHNSDQSDVDSDGWGDVCDSCRFIANADQSDYDGDLVGDACDNCRGQVSITVHSFGCHARLGECNSLHPIRLNGHPIAGEPDTIPDRPRGLFVYTVSEAGGSLGTPLSWTGYDTHVTSTTPSDQMAAFIASIPTGTLTIVYAQDQANNAAAAGSALQTHYGAQLLGNYVGNPDVSVCTSPPSTTCCYRCPYILVGRKGESTPIVEKVGPTSTELHASFVVAENGDLQNADQSDVDNDLVGDVCDNCEYDANPDQSDVDSDGVGDACDSCVDVENSDQSDMDSDGVGDVCDVCVDTVNPDQSDIDSDGVGDVCDTCVTVSNPEQTDSDSDGHGDACDVCISIADNQSDSDNDGVGNACDNCIATANSDQGDIDNDGVGNACDNCYRPGVLRIHSVGCGSPYGCSAENPVQVVGRTLTPPESNPTKCGGCQRGMFFYEFDEVSGEPISWVGIDTHISDHYGSALLDHIAALPNNALVAIYTQDQANGLSTADVAALQSNFGAQHLGNYRQPDSSTDCNSPPATTCCYRCPYILVGRKGASAPLHEAVGSTSQQLIYDFPLSPGSVPNADQSDVDNDSVGDVCDNCPNTYNPGQEDANNDFIGDACDTDDDGVSEENGVDNCPQDYNPNQSDADGDAAGDACDNCRIDTKLTIHSAGCGSAVGCSAPTFIRVGGVPLGAPATRGHHVYVVDELNGGLPSDWRVYDTHVADNSGTDMANFLNSLPANALVVIYVQDQGNAINSDGIQSMVSHFGAAKLANYAGNPSPTECSSPPATTCCYRCPYILVGRKGSATPLLEERGSTSEHILVDVTVVTDRPNAGQEDADGDGVGDSCDNCPTTPNADQSDVDTDGVGDACE